MKNFFTVFTLFLTLSIQTSANEIWRLVDGADLPVKLQRMHPTRFIVFRLDEASLKSMLLNAPADPAQAVLLSLPLPDGSFRSFRVWQKAVMPPELAARYPAIQTFTGEAAGNHTITVKLDFTDFGFHAMIFDGERTSFIDPYDQFQDGLYMAHYNHDEVRPASQRMQCLTDAHSKQPATGISNLIGRSGNERTNSAAGGTKLRTYRLALCADSWYCQAATSVSSPSISQCLSAMTTSMNRINGVFEREVALTMEFVSNEDLLIWPVSIASVNGNDPFYSINSNGNACLTRNQTIIDSIIGNANYDIGHVFTTAAGGLTLDDGIVCIATEKAQSATGQPDPVGDGFDINYVAHEMGHEFGADHPFNDNMTGSCSGNAVQNLAFEPGSGTTIMAYAGICTPDDLQPNSDAYFHTINLLQINNFITTTGDVCAAHAPSLNLPVGIDSFTANYSIPCLTPFELTAPIAHDSTADTLTTYCWDQWNLGDFGMTFAHTRLYGPLFRSFSPVAYPSSRSFPRMGHVISGQLNDAGYENNQGEKVPDTARYMTFRLAMRDIYGGIGCFLVPDDTIHLDVINTGVGFTVSSQSSAGILFTGGSTQTITWNNVGTPGAPFNTTNVDIYMSIDGGYHWMYHIGTFANSGSATVTVPNPPYNVLNARFKVKGHENVFFNINTTDFEVDYNSSLPVTASVGSLAIATAPVIFPVPAHDVLHVTINDRGPHHLSVMNSLGRLVWSGDCLTASDISLSAFPAGVYFLHVTSPGTAPETYKFIVY